jgi:hypothetical protein
VSSWPTVAAQLELFTVSRQRLVDVPIERRLAGALDVLATDQELDVTERLDLLGLVVAPAVFTEADG